MEWNDPLRLAIHEVGHVVVEYVLTDVARSCYIFTDENGDYAAQTETIARAAAESDHTESDYLNLAAEFIGGWAAVHLAIAEEILPKAPDTVETVPGDRGYFGSDQIYAHWAAVQAGRMEPEASFAAARALALDALRPRMAQVVELAEFGKGSGYVSDEMVRAAII